MRQSGWSGAWARLEHVERLLEVADVGERAPIGAEQLHVLGIAQRGLLEHRDRLGALAGRAQRLRIVDGDLRIAGIGLIALAPGLGGAVAIRPRRARGAAAAASDPVVSGKRALAQPASAPARTAAASDGDERTRAVEEV